MLHLKQLLPFPGVTRIQSLLLQLQQLKIVTPVTAPEYVTNVTSAAAVTGVTH